MNKKMDVSKYAESDYVTVQMVKDSPTKKLTILSPATEETYDGKTSIGFLVEIDGKRKQWKPSKNNLSNLISKYGTDDTAFISKVVSLSTAKNAQGKEVIVGMPQ